MYFDQRGNLKKIPELNFWPLLDVIIEKFRLLLARYQVKVGEAKPLNSFLLPMLEFDPRKRISAKDALKDNWLYMTSGAEFNMTEQEFEAYNSMKNLKQLEHEMEVQKMNLNDESDVDFADSEDNGETNFDENDSFYKEKKQKLDMKIIDRSFCNLGYIGFGDGIDFDTLDQTRNWQFDAD